MRSKTSKRIISALLAGSMVMGGAFCVQAEEAVTITVMGCNNNSEDWNNSDFCKIVNEKFGINMECTSFEWESWPTQLTLMLSSDDLPDLLACVSTSMTDINGYGEDGYFLALDEYMDQMPDFKAYLEANPLYAAAITAPDGHIYGLPQNAENEIARTTRNFINAKWLENVGMEVPTTLDEFYEVMKAFKEQDANGNGDAEDEIPFSLGFWNLGIFMPAFGMMSNSIDVAMVADEAGQVSLAQASDNYKELIRFIKKMYDEGLYDKDGLVQSTDEFNAKAKADRVGTLLAVSAPFVTLGADISVDQDWAYIGGLASEYNNDVNAIVYNSAVNTDAKIAVNVDTEYPEQICELINWLYTDEGCLTTNQGVEGIGWNWGEVEYLGGVNVVTNVNPEEDKYGSAEEYRYKKGVINNGFNVRGSNIGTVYEAIVEMDDETLAGEEVLLNQGWACLMERGRRNAEWVDGYPTLAYTAEEASNRATIVTDIRMYVEQAFGQFVTGELDIDADWDTYVETLERNGMNELVAIEQAAYDRSK